MGKNVEGKCKLCRKYRKLCKSHLASNFLYEETFDDPKGRAHFLSTDPKRDKPIQTGIFDHLLCVECEERFNTHLEQPFRKFWIDDGALDKAVANATKIGTEHSIATVSGFDYRWFKLFHLSILWRFAVSEGRYAKDFSLGPHEEIIRKMLWDLHPGKQDSYPFFGKCIQHHADAKAEHAVVGMFSKSEYNGYGVAVGVYAGCEWTFILSQRAGRNLEWLRNGTVMTKDTIWLPVQPMESIGSFRIFAEQRQQADQKGRQ